MGLGVLGLASLHRFSVERARQRERKQLTQLNVHHPRLGMVAQVAERVAVMYAGRIVEEGSAVEVLRAPRHPYTQGLLAASPTLQKRKLTPIQDGAAAYGAAARVRV
jgi:peptide/nickel transport system ATP-binding protein